jgi:hypothetical protein
MRRQAHRVALKRKWHDDMGTQPGSEDENPTVTAFPQVKWGLVTRAREDSNL